MTIKDFIQYTCMHVKQECDRLARPQQRIEDAELAENNVIGK